MAVRREDFGPAGGAVVVRFPIERVAARLQKRRQIGRRRLALSVVTLVLVLGVVSQISSAESRPVTTERPAVVVVTSGETLWELAARYAPDGADPRVYVQAVIDLNDLDGPLQAGDRIRLPK